MPIQTQQQKVHVTIHMADRVKRRKRMRRGGMNRGKALPQRQLAPTAAPMNMLPPIRRQLQQTIHLPPNAITPATPFRSQSTSHPNYVKTTEHLKKERNEAMRELIQGIDEMIGKKLANSIPTPPTPAIKIDHGVKVKTEAPVLPSLLPQKAPSTPPSSLRARRTTDEVNEAYDMGVEDPNPLRVTMTANLARARASRGFGATPPRNSNGE
jgi:hypothetical protein